MMMQEMKLYSFFFFNDTATTEIYTLSLHDALPISDVEPRLERERRAVDETQPVRPFGSTARTYRLRDRKSTRLNSSHDQISYAVFCLKKKNKHADHLSSVGVHSRVQTPLPFHVFTS